MNGIMTLGGFVLTNGIRKQIPIVNSPSKTDVANVLRSAVDAGSGVLVMRKSPSLETGAYELSMYLEKNYYVLMLEVLDSDGDVSVRTPVGSDANPAMIELFGNVYVGAQDISSIGFAQSVFEEFLITGDVSLELLN